MKQEQPRFETPSDEEFARWLRLANVAGNAIYNSDDMRNTQDGMRAYEMAMAGEIYRNALLSDVDAMILLETVATNIRGYILQLQDR